jgi:type II secretion system protein N
MTVLRYVGYAVFFVFMLVLGLYYTFPFDVAKDRILDLASKSSGMTITADELEPSWITGIVAKNVKVLQAGAKEPMTFERLTARAKLFALITGKKGAVVSLPVAKGELTADVVADEESVTVKAETSDVELGLVPGLVEALGLPLTGQTNLETDLVWGIKDPKLTNGTIKLVIKGLSIEKGGKLSGFPVPELAIGDVDWTIPVEQGKATFKNLKVAGESIELEVDGSIQLLQPVSRSLATLTLAFKPTDAFLKKEPLLGAMLNNIQRAKGADGFYAYTMSGPVKTPRFLPKAKR